VKSGHSKNQSATYRPVRSHVRRSGDTKKSAPFPSLSDHTTIAHVRDGSCQTTFGSRLS
jgi:hypothetical protein